MIISHMTTADKLGAEHVGGWIFLHKARNASGHHFQTNVIGSVVSVEHRDGEDTKITVLDRDTAKGHVEAFVEPGWAVILPTDNSPLLRS